MSVVLLTGGSSGIGLAIVRRLAARGDRVFYGSRTAAPGEFGANVTHVPLDLTDPTSCASAVSAVLDATGRLDVLINNAGTARITPLEEADDAEAHRTFEVNVFGPLRLIRAAVPVMRAAGSGRIVNVTSMNDIAPAPFGGWYSASKAALMNLTYVLGAELAGTGIAVTVVAPGFFRTAMAEAFPAERAADGSPHGAALEALARYNTERLEAAGDPDDAAAAIVDCLQAADPPARLVVGADAMKIEETIRRGSAEDLECGEVVGARSRGLLLSQSRSRLWTLPKERPGRSVLPGGRGPAGPGRYRSAPGRPPALRASRKITMTSPAQDWRLPGPS